MPFVAAFDGSKEGLKLVYKGTLLQSDDGTLQEQNIKDGPASAVPQRPAIPPPVNVDRF